MRNTYCTSWIGPPQRTTVIHEVTEGYVWVCCPDAAGLMPEALVTMNSANVHGLCKGLKPCWCQWPVLL